MKNINRLTIFCILFMIFISNPIFSQRISNHNLGKFSVKLNSDWYYCTKSLGVDWQQLSDKGMWYPNGFYRSLILKRFSHAMVMKNYIDENNDISPLTYDELQTTGGTYAIDMKEYRRYAPPSIKVDGIAVSLPYIGEIDNSIPSDVYVEGSFKILQNMGIQVFHKSYSFSNTNHDDYLIFDMTCKFTGDIDGEMGQDIPDQTVDFSWAEFLMVDIPRVAHEKANYVYGRGWGWTTWDKYTEYTGKQLLVNDKARDDLIISYQYGYDDINLVAPPGYKESEAPKYYDSRGLPDPDNGMFLAAQICGMTTFHADKATADPSDDPVNMPTNVGWLTLGDFHGAWPGGGFWEFLTRTDYNPKSAWEEYNTDPRNVGVYDNIYIMKQSYGPYTLSISDDVRSVIAVGVGMIDEDLCVSEGKKWWNWYWDKDVADDQKLDDAGKNALIETGIDSLFQVMDRAYWAYHRGYNVPDPPPAPDIDIRGGPDQIEISWSYPDPNMYKDPDTNDDDVYKWRLYRKKGAYLVYDETDLGEYYKYELIDEFDKNTTSYIDKGVQRGVKYHYCVTAIDDGSQNTNGLFPGQKLESSYYVNRNVSGVTSYKPGENVSDQVVVVPNPYSVSTGLENKLNWPGYPDEIRFMKLPAYCTLKIYTVTGDLIKTIEHVDGSADEAWENLRTDSNQYPASGVYILVIDNAKDLDKNPLSKQFVKFVIVR